MNRNTPAAPSCTAVSAARLSLSPKRMPSVLVVSFSLMIGTTPASKHAAIVSRISDQRCCSRKSRWPATQEGLCTSCKLGIHPAVAGDSRALQIYRRVRALVTFPKAALAVRSLTNSCAILSPTVSKSSEYLHTARQTWPGWPNNTLCKFRCHCRYIISMCGQIYMELLLLSIQIIYI